tara:strand:- start:392 stop:553 length:162 start_codon:yes stop_codon:yes gene_type:complete
MVATQKEEDMMPTLWFLSALLFMSIASCYFFGAGLTAIVLSLFCIYRGLRGPW